MKTFLALVLACASLLLAGDPNVNADVSVKAGSIVRQGPVHHLRGSAVLETSAIAIRADEIEFNQETNEIQAHGNVRVKLKGNPSYLFVDGKQQKGAPPSYHLRPRRTNVVEVVK